MCWVQMEAHMETTVSASIHTPALTIRPWWIQAASCPSLESQAPMPRSHLQMTNWYTSASARTISVRYSMCGRISNTRLIIQTSTTRRTKNLINNLFLSTHAQNVKVSPSNTVHRDAFSKIGLNSINFSATVKNQEHVTQCCSQMCSALSQPRHLSEKVTMRASWRQSKFAWNRLSLPCPRRISNSWTLAKLI